MVAAGTCQARDRFELAITRRSVQKEICDKDHLKQIANR